MEEWGAGIFLIGTLHRLNTFGGSVDVKPLSFITTMKLSFLFVLHVSVAGDGIEEISGADGDSRAYCMSDNAALKLANIGIEVSNCRVEISVSVMLLLSITKLVRTL